jgi:serine/threonine-protein kinase
MTAHEMNPAPLTCLNCRRELTPAALFCPACGTPRVREGVADELVGKVLGERFLVQERLGQGKSGTIYRAEHVTLRRKVAIKVLHHELSRDDLAIERFRREATSVAEIDNEHIVEIHDLGRTPDGRLYLAMELLAGETLDAALERDGQMAIERATDVVIQVGEALVEAHSVGFVHRDLRPRNIYLAVRRGKANFIKLLDFGLSKLVEGGGGAASTSLGMTFGDPRYMSPEQAKGDAIDRRADIYSLGCIAFEMLTGQPPFFGGKVFDVLTRHVSETPPLLRSRRPDAPEWLEVALARALAKGPDDRYVTAQRLVEALRVGLATGKVLAADDAVPVAVPGEGSASASDSRRGPTGTPAVGVPAVAVPEPGPAQRMSMPVAAEVAPEAAVADAAPVAKPEPAPVVAPPASKPAAFASTEPVPAISEPAPARGKRRTTGVPVTDGPTEGAVRPSDSMNLSGAWFADGEGAQLGDSQVQSLKQARQTIDPGDSLLYDDDRRDESPTKKIFLIAGLAAIGLVVAVFVLGSGEKKKAADSRANAALAIDGSSIAPAPPPSAVPDAAPGAAAVDAGVAVDAAVAVAPPIDAPAKVVVDRTPRDIDGRLPGGGSASSAVTPPPGGVDDEARKMAEFYAKAGESALRGGDPSGAAGNFQKALASNPNNVDAILGLGEVAMQQGLYTDAIRQLKRAAKLAPRSARVNVLLGESYLNSGSAALAEQSFKKALQIDPDNARARNGYNEAAGRLPPPSDDP